MTAHTSRRIALQGFLAFVFLLACAPAFAQLVLPADATLRLGGGRLALAGARVDLAGDLQVDSGSIVGAGALHILPTGVLQLDTGLLQLHGDWNNQGNFNAGQGTVAFIDGAAPSSARILGDNQFSRLDIRSSSGKRYRLETGSTQSVLDALTLQGIGAPLQIDTTTSAPLASLWLAPAASQAIDNVGVSDVHATGQHLAPAQTNQGGRGNAAGWFGTGAGTGAQPAIQIPVGGLAGNLVLLLALALAAAAALQRSAHRIQKRA